MLNVILYRLMAYKVLTKSDDNLQYVNHSMYLFTDKCTHYYIVSFTQQSESLI